MTPQLLAPGLPPQAKTTDDPCLCLSCMSIWGGNQPAVQALSVPGMNIWLSSSVYQGHAQGGDVHYISTCGGGKLARFVLADISGHGQAVGMLGNRLRRMMRQNINQLDQTKFARSLNRAFLRSSPTGHFATAVMCSYYAPSDQLLMTNAGHPRPLLYRANQKRWHFLAKDMTGRSKQIANIPLGIIAQTEYHQFALPLGRDDLVLLYSDSATEARSKTGQLLGEQGLLALVGDLNTQHPDQLISSLEDRLNGHRGGAQPDDDQTLMLLHHHGGASPAPSFGQKMAVMGKMLHLVPV